MPEDQMDIGGAILSILYIVLPLILGQIHVRGKKLSKQQKVEIFLVYFLAISVGVQGIIAGYLQIFHSDFIASYVGWQDTPFLREVGMANLSFAVLGIASIWIKGHWRTATGIGWGIYLWLAALGHIVSYFASDVMSYGNTGPTLWSDILLPLAVFILLGMRKRPAA